MVLLMGIPMQSYAASPYQKEGDFLKDLGVLKGDNSGNLMLEQNLTREQMVVLISRLYGKEGEAESYLATNSFTDLSPASKYYIPFILWARDQGLIQGMTSSTFGVGQTVTTQQFQTVLLRALGYTDEAKDWYNVPAFANQIGLMKGLSFNPDAKLNRGQVAVMLVNALSLNLKGTNSPLAFKLRLVSSPGTPVEPVEPNEPVQSIEIPTLSGSFGYINTIMLTFSKEMSKNIIENKTNYYIIQNGKELPLPEGTTILLSKDKLSVTITLPQSIDGIFTIVGLEGSVTSLKAVGLMDISGNRTDPSIIRVDFDDIASGLGKAIDYNNSHPGKEAALIDAETIKIRFNVPISAANPYDFDVPGRTVERVIIDGTSIVVLKLNASADTYIKDGTFEIIAGNAVTTLLGSPVDPMKLQVIDMVAPKLQSREADIRRGFIELRFSEPLEADGSSLYRRDFEITRLSDNVILGSDEFSTALKSGDPSVIQITLKTTAKASFYSIKLKEEPSYIRDRDGNLVITADTIETKDDI
jgi:hypothetical protein